MRTDFAGQLTQPQRRALRCWKNRKGVFTVPSVTTFSDLLNRLDNDELDRVVCGALRELSGDGADAIAVDGKTVRSTRPASGQESKLVLFAALAHDRAVVNNQIKVTEKSNEIPGMPELLEPLELDGTLVSADALHTQRETARHIVQEKGGDYLFTVKENQPELKKRIEARFEGRVFSLRPPHGR